MSNNIIVPDTQRIARMQSQYEAQRAEMLDVLQRAYQLAVDAEDAEEAARLARLVRNKLLDMSDKYAAFDRLGLDTSSVTGLLSSLKGLFSGAAFCYRQALRDLPEQLGFPFDIDWPVDPNKEDTEDMR